MFSVPILCQLLFHAFIYVSWYLILKITPWIPLHRWENRGRETLHNLSKIGQWSWIQTLSVPVQSLRVKSTTHSNLRRWPRKEISYCPRVEFSFSPGVTPLWKYPQVLKMPQSQECSFPDKHRPPQRCSSPSLLGWGRGPRSSGPSCSQGGKPSPAEPTGDVDSGGVFFSFPYLKNKQALHTPHMRKAARAATRQ